MAKKSDGNTMSEKSVQKRATDCISVHKGRGSQKLFSFGKMTAHKSKTHTCKIRDGKE